MQPPQGNPAVFNRLGIEHVINWESIERIQFKDNQEAIIHYKSGKEQSINLSSHIDALKDFVTIFPDIDNPKQREMIKRAVFSMVRTDMPQQNDDQIGPLMPKKQHGIKTDIQQH